MAKVLRFPSDAKQGPTTENRKVSRGSSRKRAAKPRKHLTEEEVERLMKAARETGRYGERDAALILLAYRHGLRVSELASASHAGVSSSCFSPTARPAGRPKVLSKEIFTEKKKKKKKNAGSRLLPAP